MPHQEHEPPREPQAAPNCLTAQFLNKRPAGRAYARAQATIYQAPACDLSVFRLMIPSRHTWLVTVIGQQPKAPLGDKLAAILATGMPTTMPADVLQLLQARRAEAIRQAPWVERHFPPQTHN